MIYIKKKTRGFNLPAMFQGKFPRITEQPLNSLEPFL